MLKYMNDPTITRTTAVISLLANSFGSKIVPLTLRLAYSQNGHERSVVLLFEAKDFDRAKALFESPDLRETMEKAGVIETSQMFISWMARRVFLRRLTVINSVALYNEQAFFRRC
jgi:hypothetical protein